MRARAIRRNSKRRLFRGFKENGLLKDPAEVATKIVDRLVLSPWTTAAAIRTRIFDARRVAQRLPRRAAFAQDPAAGLIRIR
jgi:hypothetical protein